MTPVLGIPVINRPDLLRLCLASIDHPVRLVVIDNSGTGELGDIAAEFGALVVEPAANLGFTASVNHIIRSFPFDPYWLIANADTEFAPGDIERLCAEPGGFVGINGDWRIFKLTAETVEAIGMWDENFFVYCSDADYERRCDIGGIDRHFITGATTHVGSVAIAEARYGAHNARSYRSEREYHVAKWGVDVRMQGGYETPFDQGGHLGDWRADLSRLRQVSWNGDLGTR